MIYFKKITFLVLIIHTFFSCVNNQVDNPVFQQAIENGKAANEGFSRSLKFVNAWLANSDSVSGLIPRNLYKDKDFWNAKDAAADNYPFMVLTSSIVDKNLYEGKMLDMLKTEIKLSSRVGNLPDSYSFRKQAFLKDKVEMGSILFGASEYMKDGLMPLTEWLGNTPWLARMKGILDDFHKEVEVITTLDGKYFGNSAVVEINGELLQVLSRMYWITGEQNYLDWAIKIGDYYLLNDENLPSNMEYLRLRDHGCEIISGLSELYLTLHFVDTLKKIMYKKPMHQMLDRILEIGRNEHGLFYNGVNGKTGEIIDTGIADNFGYTYNAYYSVYLIDGNDAYRDAVLKGLNNLHFYKNYVWEGDPKQAHGSADGYADAIEGTINLYNRESIASVKDWIDSEIKVMFSIQKDNGIVEGWHGDGNFARTAIMYSLWKTKGLTINPWRKDLIFGAVEKDDKLWVSMQSGSDWNGKLIFDKPRYKENLNMPIDYPRINQFPEWFTAQKDAKYKVRDLSDGKTASYSGKDLQDGLEIGLNQGETKKLIIEKMD